MSRLWSPGLSEKLSCFPSRLLFHDYDLAAAPAIARWRDVDEQGCHQSGDWNNVPLPSKPMLHHQIPKGCQWENQKAEDRPKHRCKDAIEPICEQPKQNESEPRQEQSC